MYQRSFEPESASGRHHGGRGYSGDGSDPHLKDRKIRVPEQIRLVSLTGHSIGGLLETTMTSLEIPAHELGEKATHMVIDEIEAPSDSKPSVQHLVFSASLVERGKQLNLSKFNLY